MIKVICDLCGFDAKDYVDVVAGLRRRQICQRCVEHIRGPAPAKNADRPVLVLEPNSQKKLGCPRCEGAGWINGYHGYFESCPKCKSTRPENPAPSKKTGGCGECGGRGWIDDGAGVARCLACKWTD